MPNVQEFKCPNCGGSIEFDSSKQKLKCPYCDTVFDIDDIKAYVDIKKEDVEDDMSWESHAGQEWNDDEASNMNVYTCNSCGGELVTDENTAATSCPFCGSPVILTGRLAGDLKPDLVIPFKLDKKYAKEKLKEHVNSKKLVPDLFKEENHIDEIKGMYVPFWIFDADAEADARYKATRVHFWSDGDYDYTETSHYSIVRSGDMKFRNVPVDGSSKIADELMESIEPFDISEAVDFETPYLAGYLADRYDVTEDDSVSRANDRIKNSSVDALASTVDGFYATVIPEYNSVRLKNGSAKYALYPVWMLTTSWNNEKYTFVMNAQTGKFVGNLPMDSKKFFKFFGIYAIIATLVVYAAAFAINML